MAVADACAGAAGGSGWLTLTAMSEFGFGHRVAVGGPLVLLAGALISAALLLRALV